MFEIELIIYIKMDLALNNLQRLICHKTPTTSQPTLLQWYHCWLTIVEADLNASSSITTTPKYRGERYSFLWIAPLTLDPYLLMLRVKQGVIKNHFYVLGMTRPVIEPWSHKPFANTLTIMLVLLPFSQKELNT